MNEFTELHLLLIEDEPDHAQLLAHWLSRHTACTISHFANSQSAIASLQKNSYDLILLDYSLPDLDGIEVLRLLRRNHAQIPVIMITGQGDERTAVEAMKLGASDYVIKSANYTSTLHLSVDRVMEKTRLWRQLEESQARYRRLVENSFMGIFQCTPEGRFLMVNEALVALLGYESKEELMEVDIGAQLYLEAAEHKALVSRIENEGEVRDAIQTFRKRDGCPMVVRQNVRAVRDCTQHIVCLEGMVQDITQQRRAEAEIRRLAAFPRLSPYLMLELNEHGAVQYFNAATSEFLVKLGYSTEDIYSILPADLEQICRELVKQNQPGGRITRAVNAGNRVLSYEFHFIPEERTVHVHGADITEQRLLESRLREAQQAESIGRLAAGIAHDFNNSLMGIIGHASLIRDAAGSSFEFDEELRQIEQAAQHAAEVTQQLLIYSRKSVGDRVELYPNTLIRSVVDSLMKNKPAGIDLHMELQPKLPKVLLDPMQIHQALANLFQNAYDAMSNQGDLFLGSYLSNGSDLEVDAATEAPVNYGSYVVIAIRDTGKGIEPESLQCIFDPYYTTKENGEGPGLGLATVYGIVKTHGGVIHVDSRPGEGAEFRLYFPVAQ